MRKNSPRKWLHAILDLLPVLIIGVFALYTTNKNASFDHEVSVPQYKVVDFNQYVPNAYLDYINSEYVDTRTYFQFRVVSRNDDNYISTLYQRDFVNVTGLMQGTFVLDQDINGVTKLQIVHNGQSRNLDITKPFNFNYHYGDTLMYSFYLVSDNPSSYNDLEINSIQIFNLTQAFGDDLPTISEFNSIFPHLPYDYTASDELLLNVGDFSYNDSDIGSQLTYTLYNTTVKYFNMNQVFNLGSIWEWIILNIFNGNPPLIAFFVWNVIIYEFIIDILFIFYAFFMFLIDFIDCLLEKPFRKINRG